MYIFSFWLLAQLCLAVAATSRGWGLRPWVIGLQVLGAGLVLTFVVPGLMLIFGLYVPDVVLTLALVYLVFAESPEKSAPSRTESWGKTLRAAARHDAASPLIGTHAMTGDALKPTEHVRGLHWDSTDLMKDPLAKRA